jgi:hypothetical protein
MPHWSDNQLSNWASWSLGRRTCRVLPPTAGLPGRAVEAAFRYVSVDVAGSLYIAEDTATDYANGKVYQEKL